VRVDPELEFAPDALKLSPVVMTGAGFGYHCQLIHAGIITFDLSGDRTLVGGVPPHPLAVGVERAAQDQGGQCVTNKSINAAMVVLISFLARPILAQESYISIETKLQQETTCPSADRVGEVTMVRITIPPGASTERHFHPYPPFVYVMKGSLEVTDQVGATRAYKAGDAFMESGLLHAGRNPGSEPAELIAVFMGIKGQPLTVPEIAAGRSSEAV
jgi:quercetin dioxygenase-like cupin family protein